MSHHDRGTRGHRVDRIERAVADALEFDLLPSLQDPLLADLHLISIEASNNLASIQVVVAPSVLRPDDPQIQEALDKATGWLRSELASMLTIKRMPALKLRYVPVPLGKTGGGV
jgi:ribosome-binding factor A